MAGSRSRHAFLWLLQHTLNRLTRRLAHSGHGPFSLICHVGRRTGTPYETPVILARVPAGFVAELTYGPQVAWHRNIRAAGGCVVLYQGVEHVIDRVETLAAEDGLRAFDRPARIVLTLLSRRDFLLLHELPRS